MISANNNFSDNQINPANNSINWNDFNYPICLKLFHYDRTKVPEAYRRQVVLLWLNHILISVSMGLNLLTNIIATAQG